MKKFIPISEPSITQREVYYVTDAISSGWVSSLGKYISIFEERFAQFCDVKYALSTSNGTSALHLSLVALGIESGDEVIIPDFTFIATASAVNYTGAKVVTVDIEEETLCISPDSIEKSITDKTKAIIPVHIYGHPADMERINQIAQKNNLFVVEDCAEAHGAEINGKRVGGLSDVGIFSFYGNKLITTGEGGMITTNNRELYEKMKKLRDHAMDLEKRYWHTEVGFNYRMTNLQAALGVAQFERIDELLQKKLEIFEWYREFLKDIPDISLNRQKSGYKNVYWMICMENINWDEETRNSFMKKLKNMGVDSRPYFYPVSDMVMYERSETAVVHRIYKRGINLPSYFDISKSEVEYISSCVRNLL